MDQLNALTLRVEEPNKITYMSQKYKTEYETAQEAVKAKEIDPEIGATVHAWTPAYDNYDGSE